MTAKNDDYDYNDLLLEAELLDETGEYGALLNEISSSPSKYGRVDPPAGYENQLVAALKMRIPMEAKAPLKASQHESRSGFITNFISSTKIAWSFSGVMAVFVAVLAFQSLQQSEKAFEEGDYDILSQTAQRGNSEAVERWLASVSDLGVQALHDPSAGIVQELSDADPATAQKALEDVARSLGYKKGI